MNEQDRQGKQMEQLEKAESMLETTLSEYEHLPYLG
jgi:C4-dicarboxylate-specific signal transduction histidine kinase